jgi:hypothetical protein
MAEHMSHLLSAVKVSGEIHTLREELEEIPVKVREIEGELKNLQEDYSSKKSQAEKIESEKKKLHLEMQAEGTHLEEKEKRLNTIKTQKEYQAVVREITMAKTSNRERQDRLTQLEADLDASAQVLAPLEENLNSLKGRLEQEKADIQGTLEKLETQISSLEAQLHEQLQALPDDIRQKYQRIGKSVQPPAAAANSGTCHGCFMHLPPQLFIEIQRGQEVHSCPNCHRLLYLESE